MKIYPNICTFFFRWFAGKIARSQAERLVSRQNLPKGTFLIRERDIEPLEYALTIRDENNQRGVNPVKHYKIRRLDNEFVALFTFISIFNVQTFQ